MSLIIDSLKLGCKDHADITVYIKDDVLTKYNTFNLNNILIKHVEVRQKIDYICYIRCSLIDKDTNIFNGEKSDIIGVIPVFLNNPKRYFDYRLNIQRSIGSKDFNAIRITLEGFHDNVIEHVVYELEFF